MGPQINPVYAHNYRLSVNPLLGYELLPGSPDGEGVINSDGMRDPERAIEKAAGLFRIACIGDSVTFSLAVAQPESYPAALEEALNERLGGPDLRFEALNFGVTGYNILQNLENLRVRALKYRPDVILYQYCVNDPQEYSFEMENLRAQLSRAEEDYLDASLALDRGLLASSRLYRLARYAAGTAGRVGQATREPEPDEQWWRISQGTYPEYFRALHDDPAGWQRVRDGFAQLAALAALHEATAVVVMFPLMRNLSPYALEDVHDRVVEEARRQGLAVLDLLPLFQQLERAGRPRYAREAIHPNAYGNRRAAQAIVDWLRKEKLLPQAPAVGAAGV